MKQKYKQANAADISKSTDYKTNIFYLDNEIKMFTYHRRRKKKKELSNQLTTVRGNILFLIKSYCEQSEFSLLNCSTYN